MLGWFGCWQVVAPIVGSFVSSALLGLILFFMQTRQAAPYHHPTASVQPDDDDVAREHLRVPLLRPTDAACMYRDLHHTYNAQGSPVHAVRGISLAVHSGECFGLLGPNGAGKTTTLGCLTGEIRPTAGEVIVAGYSVHGEQRFSAFQHLGYCPQADPIWPQLTGHHHLVFYAVIKGVPRQRAAGAARQLLRQLGFEEADMDKPAEQYSGGMKRKLAVGISLIGSSKVLLLDEPSAAVDAGAKRQLWKVIRARPEGQSIVVTTHSMEEAEALCDRLAIQTVGRLRCLGSPHHIKSKFGSGYSVELTLPLPVRAGADVEIDQFMKEQLAQSCQLMEQHRGRLVYQLPAKSQGGLSLGQVFTRLQRAKDRLGLLDYSVAQPTLEQVFLRFAKEQEDAEGRQSE